MSMARTARRRRKQMSSNNAQWSGLGVPRYSRKALALQQEQVLNRATMMTGKKK